MSSNTDIRLKLSFQHHPKTKKLKFKLGADAVLSFIYLLMFAAANKPGGFLGDMTAEDLAIAADYDGDPDEFLETLLAVRFLRRDPGTDELLIHDWGEHNAYAAAAAERSEHARRAAEARWRREKGRGFSGSGTRKQDVKPKTDAAGINEQCEGDARGNAPSPSPSPSPRASRAGAYENWKPDKITLNRIRQSDPDITDGFLEEILPEFRSYAEGHYRENQLAARFISSARNQWRRRKLDEAAGRTPKPQPTSEERWRQQKAEEAKRKASERPRAAKDVALAALADIRRAVKPGGGEE